MKKIACFVLAVILTMSLAGCAETGELTIKYGETTEIMLAKAYQDLVWESSDTAVATVENGTVTGVGPGQAIITAASNSKTAAKYTVSVEIVEIAEVFLQADELTIRIGESADLSYSLFPLDASDYGLVYTSINPEIAAVDDSGHIEAASVGKTNVVLSTPSGKTVACKVIVEEPSAIEQLNDNEAELFDYLINEILCYAYNAPALRIRNLYSTVRAKSPESSATAVIQGTNKVGGTIFKCYVFFKSSESGNWGHFELSDSYNVKTDREIIPMPAEIFDHVKLNAALDEYWSNSNISN